MKNFKHRFIRFVTTDRRTPDKNRELVGQNMMILSIFVFFIFIINFAIIIGTDTKFGVKLSDEAKNVYQTSRTIQARRGTIYDRNGIPIAEDSTTYSVFAIIDKDYISVKKEPLYIQESQYDQVADIFHRYLDLEKDYVIEQLKLDDLSQVSFGTKGGNISYSTMKTMTEEFEALGIKGIDFTSSPSRLYPNGSFASHFIGLAQPVENDDASKSLVGQTGLEFALNDILAGQDGLVTYQKDRNGNVQLGTAQIEQEAINGQDVYTTLSAPLQLHLETLINEFQANNQGIFSSATLTRAKTGEILATSQRPSFNSDTKDGLNNDNFSWQTYLYQNNYEPGSTFKTLTTAIALDVGVFDASEMFFNDELQIADATIRDWDVNAGVASGRYMTMADALPFSSNIGMTMLQQKIGEERWINYLNKFKFGLPTRFGMAGEEAGVFPADNTVTYAMSSFGQGISVTQTQMLRAFSAIANDGVMVQPQFISHLADSDTGAVRWADTEVVGKPVSADSASITRDYMVAVGTDPEFGTLYNLDEGIPYIRANNDSVAVKSGTAQIAAPIEEGGGYLTGPQDYTYSVVAMIPAHDPEFIMYATIQQPQEQWTGGTQWSNLFNPLLEEAMLMKDNLDLDRQEQDVLSYFPPEVNGQVPGEFVDELRRHLVHPILLGTGNKIIKMSYEMEENLEPNRQVLLLTNHFDALPDFYGWTRENVETFAEWMGWEITIKGKGRVIKQSLEAGTELEDISSLTVTLGSD